MSSMSNNRNRPPVARSQPVLWWELINEVEDLSARRNIGLANVWGFIHREDYAEALASLDQAKVDWA